MCLASIHVFLSFRSSSLTPCTYFPLFIYSSFYFLHDVAFIHCHRLLYLLYPIVGLSLLLSHQTFQTPDRLYLLTEIVQGGELFSYLYENKGQLPRSDLGGFVEPIAQFYASCVISAFSHMHSLDIVYRDRDLYQ